MVEVTLARLTFAWISGFLVQAIVMQFPTRYGSPRGYFLLSSVPAALVFFISLLYIYPMIP